MKRAFRKKGIVFTIAAILLVGVILTSLAIVAKTTYRQKSFVALSRVTNMNDFILSVHGDAERSMMISGYRSFISLQKFIASNGSFVQDFDSSFQEIFLNGTINGTPQELMVNASIKDWTSRINEEAGKLNINIDILPQEVFVQHSSPWTVVIRLNATINVSDKNGLASWYYNKSFEKNIDITGFEDPLYTVKSYDKVTNLIRIANDTNFVDSSDNDTTVLYLHLNSSYYVPSDKAPSFLMRFEGNLSPSPYGIESLVDILDFSKQSLEVYNKSVIDYEYFNDTYDFSNDKCNFPDMPSWFRIDENRLGTYNLTGLGEDC